MTQDIRQIDPESLDPRGKVGAHLWNIDGVLGRSWGLRAEMGYDLFSGWSRSLRRPPGQGVAMEDKREGGHSAPRGPAQQPSPLWGWKDPSQIKIAGKEQPRIVPCKSREIRRVSCGLGTASHTAVIHSLMKTLPRLAILRAKSFSAPDPEQRVVILGQTLVVEDNEGSLFFFF